jgi:hypothetical protein
MEHVNVVWWVAIGGVFVLVALTLLTNRETVHLAVPGVDAAILEPGSLGLAAVTADGGGDGGGVVGDGGNVGVGDAGGHAVGADGGGVGHGGGDGGHGGH